MTPLNPSEPPTAASADVSHYDYVIVGGGMVADSAAKAMHELDPKGSILIVGRDPDPAVTRPALSKKLWTDPDFAFDQVWLNTAKETGCEVWTGVEVDSIHPREKTIAAGGDTISYGRLLLATGGQPRTLDLPDDDRVIYFRTLADYRRLRVHSGSGQRVVVIGGGYIGTELACALAGTNTKVTFVYAEERVNDAPFPAELAERVSQSFRDHGVSLRPRTEIVSGRRDGNTIVLRTDQDEEMVADAVVVGIGIEPETALAEKAGLSVNDGIVVGERLTTSDPHIFAAGDVANYPDRLLGWRRVEHVDNANQMGTRVGEIMAGQDAVYDHTPYYYSVIFGTRYEAVGTLDSSLSTVEDWSEDRSAGVVYYLDDGEVIGVLLWNVADRTDDARAVIAESKHHTTHERDLYGRIPLS